MIKEISKLSEEVFQELSKTILGSPQQLQDKLIDDIFADFPSQSSTSKIRNIEE